MDVISLQSGSSGNCTCVSAGGTTVLIDAGISGRKCHDRMTAAGLGESSVDAVVISHDHSDHTASMGVLHRRFAAPVYITKRTLQSVRRKRCPGAVREYRHFHSGTNFDVGSLRIETIPTPHDAADGVCFVIEERATGIRFGLLTDLGHCFEALTTAMSSLDAVLIESNYDPDMLKHSLYPRHLKQRVAGPQGHISNGDAAGLLAKHTGRHLQWACLGHLSDESNTPEIALQTSRKAVGKRFPIVCADRHAAIETLTIKPSLRTRRSRSPRQLELVM